MNADGHINYLLDEDSPTEPKIRHSLTHRNILETNSYGIDSPISSSNNGANVGMSLREQDDQLQMLRKENFHLKLRIYFLQQSQSLRAEGVKPNFCESSQNDNEKIELKITSELLRSELQEKQLLICEAAMAMEQMERIKQQEQYKNQEIKNQLHQQIHELETRIEELNFEGAPLSDRPLDLTMANPNAQRITELQLDVAKYEMELEEKNTLINTLRDSLNQKDHCIRELQLNLNRSTYTVEELRQNLSEKDDKLSQLKEFRCFAKQSFATQMDNISMQQHKLYETMGVLHQKIDQYELNGEVFDENLRIISEQRRIMQDLHNHIETKKMSMNELRQELNSAERELSEIRNEKDLLLNQLEFFHNQSINTNTNQSSSGYETIQERSEDDEYSASRYSTESLPHLKESPDDQQLVTSIPSESNLFGHIWQIDRITSQRDGFLFKNPSATNSIKHTKSMQKMPILINPMFAGFDSASSIPYHRLGSAVLAKSKHPLKKTISLELPNMSTNKTSEPNGASKIHSSDKTDARASSSIVSHGLRYLFDRITHT